MKVVNDDGMVDRLITQVSFAENKWNRVCNENYFL